MPRHKLDLTGQRYGMLTVIKEAPKGNSCGSRWLCRCDCGNYKIVYCGNLRSKKDSTKSCGCLLNKFLKSRYPDNINYASINGKMYKNNKTGIKGVSWRKDSGKYRAGIGYKRRIVWLGCSEDIETCSTIREMAVDAVNNGTFEDFYYALKGKKFE